MTPVALRHLFELRAQVGAPVVGHASARGLRRVVPVLGLEKAPNETEMKTLNSALLSQA